MTIGLLPGKNKTDANAYIDIALPTTIGYARNAMVAASADIIVALPGSFGTNSEICYGLVYGRPVIDLGGWKMKGMVPARNVAEAREKIKEIIKKLQQIHVLKHSDEYHCKLVSSVIAARRANVISESSAFVMPGAHFIVRDSRNNDILKNIIHGKNTK